MYPRFVEHRVREALDDTRVVLVCGPRQSGKTTLAQEIANEAMPFITLDGATTLKAVSTGPVGFMRGLDRAVIDEVQRAPDLILAIKATVDTGPRPGEIPDYRLRRPGGAAPCHGLPASLRTPVGARSDSAWPVHRGNAGGLRCL